MRTYIILLFFWTSSIYLFGQEDFKKITTYINDSSEIVYKYYKGDSCICSSIFDLTQNLEIFTMVFEEPLFGKCNSVFESNKNIYTYIQKNINYPLNSDQYETGKIFIKFIVDTDGSLTNFKILKGLESWNNEAVRVIKSMPKWEPAKCNGKKVPYYFIYPVNIKLY
jgi:hypothetical protein